MHQLENALDGDLDTLIAELESHEQSDRLREATAGTASEAAAS
jgi:protein subunit release factor A